MGFQEMLKLLWTVEPQVDKFGCIRHFVYIFNTNKMCLYPVPLRVKAVTLSSSLCITKAILCIFEQTCSLHKKSNECKWTLSSSWIWIISRSDWWNKYDYKSYLNTNHHMKKINSYKFLSKACMSQCPAIPTITEYNVCRVCLLQRS